MNLLDRMILAISPQRGLARARARAAAQIVMRHFDAAAPGRRTDNWSKGRGDANSAAGGVALSTLRAVTRDLVRNNAWGRRGLRVIANNTVGTGILIKPGKGGDTEKIEKAWKRWATTTDCDAAGRLTFFGIQRQCMTTIAEAGEVLVRRRWRRPMDGLSIPIQLQLLEPDHLDSSQDSRTGVEGGPIIHGVEHDALGRRVAYWLFDEHPGSSFLTNPVSRRIPARDVIHVFYQERIGQVRGVPWFAPVLLRAKDFDEYEDATLMKQKIAACMSVFVTDVDGAGTPLGEATPGANAGDPGIDTLEPGSIINLPAGKQVTVANPPATNDHASYSATTLRAIAAGLGISYEELTKDYSQVNYASSRMSRLATRADVLDWQWNMLIPLLCDPVWQWVLEALDFTGIAVGEPEPATWTPPPPAMIDPEKEGRALIQMVRAGAMTHDAMVREQGLDPEEHWEEMAEGNKKRDELGIVLDSDPRKITGSGQLQPDPAQKPAAGPPKPGAPPPGAPKPPAEDDEPTATTEE